MLGKALVVIESHDFKLDSVMVEVFLHVMQVFHDGVIDEFAFGEIERDAGGFFDSLEFFLERDPISKDGRLANRDEHVSLTLILDREIREEHGFGSDSVDEVNGHLDDNPN